MRIRDQICKAVPFLYPVLRIPIHWVRWFYLGFREIPIVRKRYQATLLRLQRECKERKMRVLFLFNENSQWKCQHLYEVLDASDLFEPVIALTRGNIDWNLSTAEFSAKFKANMLFCERHGLRYIEAYSLSDNRPIELSVFKPDFVFYQHPWSIPDVQMPWYVSSYALTCYVPYYILVYTDPISDSQQFVHQFAYRYFFLNDYLVQYFTRKRHGFRIAGEWLGLGHPMLDIYANPLIEKSDVVIYAPHWSVHNKTIQGQGYSTFLEMGNAILQYAQKHSEMKWCFKPHPNLRRTLEFCDGWSREKVDDYYAAWEKIGVACYTGDYPAVFMRSLAMITDCTSFLLEYSSLNKPLIHLVSPHRRHDPAKVYNKLLDSFYQVKSLEDLHDVLKLVVEERKDPKSVERLAAITELNLLNSRASERIVDHLTGLIVGNDKENKGNLT